ncbi:unnamed protein product [Notodromas monacha]|uniref:Ig-like domain-containing protein n=1 Tax=Notodromas monacha TaxID=399045 RepID=A0A7R9GA75_9CRUS|nr:unnamed protein product [Notodromas monacha]CAG0915054.1 unnamed protein product [Notodromas monacha]
MQVAWVHVDRKMVIAIHEKVTTRIPRFGVSFDGDKTTWRLHIYNVHEDDKGKYMCQLNTIPMQAQIGILNVVVPPWIDDQMSSASTISVPENSDVMLQCHARGFPTPSIEWRREDDLPIRLKSRGAGAYVKPGLVPVYYSIISQKKNPLISQFFLALSAESPAGPNKPQISAKDANKRRRQKKNDG